MINLKDAKEVKRKVEEIKAKRANTKVVNNKTKKNVKNENKKQRETNKKFKKFLFRFIVMEYIICAGIMILIDYNSLAVENQIKDLTIKSQQETILKLIAPTSGEEKVKIVKYMANSEQQNTAQNNENKTYLGKFKITHYCACTKCCGKNACGITASGKPVEENKTIAVDPSVIKLGSQVYIDGYGYMEAQDTGSAIKGNIIDVYIPDHQEALKLGVVYKDVYLVK